MNEKLDFINMTVSLIDNLIMINNQFIIIKLSII